LRGRDCQKDGRRECQHQRLVPRERGEGRAARSARHDDLKRLRVVIVVAARPGGFFMAAGSAPRCRRVPGGSLIFHACNFALPGTGRLPPVPNRSAVMLKRLLTACVLAITLTACQQTRQDNFLIQGGGPVKVLQTTYVSTGDSSNTLSGGGLTYVVCKIEYTNTFNQPFNPIIEHFTLVDTVGNRYSAVDSGSTALAGISNDLTPMKPGDKRTFTIGFRVESTTAGAIEYDY
jgi:hypothetical protein